MKYCLIGNKVNYSLSPIIYSYWANFYSINMEYFLVNTEKIDSDMVRNFIFIDNFKGINLTQPFKEVIIEFDFINHNSQEVQKIRAANTLAVFQEEIFSFNTDYKGLAASFIHWNLAFLDKRILVIGAGGASRALIHTLESIGVHGIYLMNRTTEKIKKLQLQFEKLYIHPRDDISISEFDMIFNTTSLSIDDIFECFNINLTKLKNNLIIYDMNYQGICKSTQKAIEAKNILYIDGICMLLYQAIENFNIWFNIYPKLDKNLLKIVYKSL